MSILDLLIGVLAPHECMGCFAEGSLLCFDCSNRLRPCTMPPLEINHLDTVGAATNYKELAKQLLWKLKSDGAQSAAKVIAYRMAKELKGEYELIVPIPTATKRVRTRGYDQAKLITRELSRLSRLKMTDCLVRTSQTHQVGSNREIRLKQISGSFRLKNKAHVKGLNILLIDDVITTGASVETAAEVLKRAGAKKVSALAFARA